MRQVRRWMMVLLCCAAAAARGETPPDSRRQEAQSALDEASSLWDAGRYADAIARGEHALALSEAMLGGSHLDMLGLRYWAPFLALGSDAPLRRTVMHAPPSR